MASVIHAFLAGRNERRRQNQERLDSLLSLPPTQETLAILQSQQESGELDGNSLRIVQGQIQRIQPFVRAEALPPGPQRSSLLAEGAIRSGKFGAAQKIIQTEQAAQQQRDLKKRRDLFNASEIFKQCGTLSNQAGCKFHLQNVFETFQPHELNKKFLESLPAEGLANIGRFIQESRAISKTDFEDIFADPRRIPELDIIASGRLTGEQFDNRREIDTQARMRLEEQDLTPQSDQDITPFAEGNDGTFSQFDQRRAIRRQAVRQQEQLIQRTTTRINEIKAGQAERGFTGEDVKSDQIDSERDELRRLSNELLVFQTLASAEDSIPSTAAGQVVLQGRINALLGSPVALTKEGSQMIKRLTDQALKSDKLIAPDRQAQIIEARLKASGLPFSEEQRDAVLDGPPLDNEFFKTLNDSVFKTANDERKADRDLGRIDAKAKSDLELIQSRGEVRKSVARFSSRLKERLSGVRSDLDSKSKQDILRQQNDFKLLYQQRAFDDKKLDRESAMQRTTSAIDGRADSLRQNRLSREKVARENFLSRERIASMNNDAKKRNAVEAFLRQQRNADQEFQREKELRKFSSALKNGNISLTSLFDLGETAGLFDFEAANEAASIRAQAQANDRKLTTEQSAKIQELESRSGVSVFRRLASEGSIPQSILTNSLEEAINNPKFDGFSVALFDGVTASINSDSQPRLEDLFNKSLIDPKLKAENRREVLSRIVGLMESNGAPQEVVQDFKRRVPPKTTKVEGQDLRNLATLNLIDPDNVRPEDIPTLSRLEQQLADRKQKRSEVLGTGLTKSTESKVQDNILSNINVLNAVRRIKDIVRSNPEVVGFTGSLRQFVTGASQQAQLLIREVATAANEEFQGVEIDQDALEALREVGFEPGIRDPQGDRFQYLRGTLVFLLAKANDPSGRLSVDDVRRAEQQIGGSGFGSGSGPEQFLNRIDEIIDVSQEKINTLRNASQIIGGQQASPDVKSIIDQAKKNLGLQ